MNKLKTLIVDDEILARKSLQRLAEKHERIELIDVVESAEKALEVIESKEIDLVFLDVEMPGLSGIELIDKLPYMPHIVISTGNREYAYDAFEYDVTDFISKPVAMPRFLSAIEKALQNEERIQQIAGSSSANELYVKVDQKLIRLPYDKILYFENVGDYVKVITEDMGVHVIYGALKKIDQKLNYPRFLKVHRSYIVNLDKVKDYRSSSTKSRSSF